MVIEDRRRRESILIQLADRLDLPLRIGAQPQQLPFFAGQENPSVRGGDWRSPIAPQSARKPRLFVNLSCLGVQASEDSVAQQIQDALIEQGR